MSSRIPSGDFTPTLGSNYMLDGFDFSEDYGEGVLTNRKIPNTSRTTGMAAPPRSEKGLAGIPDGFIVGEKEACVGDDVFDGTTGTDVGDLSEMVKTAGHITDLTWLETAEQDPDRLPTTPNDKALQGLVEAWGVNRRTDGVELIPNVVVPPPPRSQVALLPGDHFREVVASAMRKLAFGVPYSNIVADVAVHLGSALENADIDPRVQKLANVMRFLRSEQGVVGKVYLRDVAFPGLLSGKWDQDIKRRCASARYWLTHPGSKLSAYQNYLGKQVVTEIPWAEALDHYRPMLEASGKRLASGDPKIVLISAIRGGHLKRGTAQYAGTGVGVSVPVRMSSGASTTANEQAKLTSDMVSRQRKAAEAKVASVFRKWVAAGLLTDEQAAGLIAKDASAMDRIRAGAALASARKAARYQGREFHSNVAHRQASLGGGEDIRPVLRYAMVQMNEGMAGRDLDTMLASRFSQDLLKVAEDKLVQLRRQHEGLAGHLYVTASAYASPMGTTGCDKGALVHRANQVKSVLQMSRCASCAANSGGACQKYNKTLVTAAPVENPEAYQKETIRLANADDSEKTAAMFNAYDPGEFGLQNDTLDSFEYSNLPDNTTLNDILFEGMTLPEE